MEVFEKSQTIDPEVRAYVYSLVSAVGGSSAVDDGRYVLGDDAIACLKDLRRWLKLYDTKLERFDVKRCLSEANLVKGDLLEILGQWKEYDETNVLRRKVAIGSLELLTELTWPLHVDPERATVNQLRHLPVIQLAQLDYKRAILHHESEAIFHKAIAVAIPALSIPRRERSPRDEGIINLVLYFFRNIAMITQPPNLPSNGDESDISRSEVIRALHTQDVLQLMLTICSGMGEEFDQQDIVVMEFLFHLLKGIDPVKLMKDDKEVKKDNVSDFKRLLRAEKSMLASQAKTAPSRHNRFGTMIWVKQADQKLATMTGQDLIGTNEKTYEKMDATKKWNRPKPKARIADSSQDGSELAPENLDGRARAYLRSFVSEFLDSCFNPLFIHLRRALEREADRVKEETHPRQFFFLISWFLKAEETRRSSNKDAEADVAQIAPMTMTTTTTDSPFAYIAGVLTQESFALLNRTMQKNMDDKSWHGVHACLLAFTQIMLTVWAMSESPSEDDQEIAENIQNRIFYEEQTHDRILQVLRGYQDGRQDFRYLDACTELAHIFLRLLERYSKVNVDMYVRSKRRARKKAKAKPKGSATIEGLENDTPQQEEDGANDEVEAHREVQERKFDFTRFAARFVNETSINTFVALLSRYRDLNEDQLKRCHRFFYRVAFKMELPILLYRVDILNLFNKVVQGPHGLDSLFDKRHTHFKEWEELIKQIFKRCIKKLEERPELFVEMLFTKIPSTLFFLEHGYDKEVIKSVPRPPAELEVRSGMDHAQQIGVAVGVLVDQGKLDMLAWVKTVLMTSIDERRSWEELDAALRESRMPDTSTSIFDRDSHKGQTATEQESQQAPAIVIKPDSGEKRVATFKDKHLRLLFKTLGFERLGSREDPNADWTIPPGLTSSTLEEDLDTIRKFEFEPPVYEDGRSAESFTRSETAANRKGYEKNASEDDGDSDLDESLFVPGGPTIRPSDANEDRPRKKRRLRRKGEEISDQEREERAAARKQREKEKDAKVKSALFVTESDDEDDEERDAEFFRLEAQRRGNAAQAIKTALMDGRSGHGEEKSTKKRRTSEPDESAKRRRVASAEEDEMEEDEMEANMVHADLGSDVLSISSRESSPGSESSLSDEETDERLLDDEETPLSSQTAATGDHGQQQARLSDDEDGPVKTSRRTTRQMFVIDDDDSD
ncbi:hypothetical protein ANO11243_060860 [Dothideomycetidae sp. 11243]|nr:hypothetical protein ANO11243_060860 [fungal sp. No.11243]